MSSVLDVPSASIQRSSPWLVWWPAALGFAAMYGPTYARLWNDVWSSEEQAHGPIILVVVAWLAWTKRAALNGEGSTPRSALGYALLIPGLLLYVLGRSQDILVFEVGSQIPVLAGLLLLSRGAGAVRALWFPLLFLVFMVPLPAFVIDGLTGPLKQFVSRIAEQLLYSAGYPVGRQGVTLTVGQYQLLVADACSGMHAIFSLTALGVLYLYLMRHASVVRNVVLAASIIPIALLANLVRVVLLVLITYHLGDAAAQGFLHGFAGMVLFVAALLLLFMVDGLFAIGRHRDPARRSGKPRS